MPVVIAVLALLLAVRDCLAKQALGGVSQEGRCGYTSCTQDSASQSLRMSVAMQKKKALRKKEEEEPVDLSFLEAEAASAAAQRLGRSWVPRAAGCNCRGRAGEARAGCSRQASQACIPAPVLTERSFHSIAQHAGDL